MDEREDKPREGEFAPEEEKSRSEDADECASIQDPVRRTLCEVCNKPVIGLAPFCQEHEPPVP
jgi:hypothetical protein